MGAPSASFQANLGVKLPRDFDRMQAAGLLWRAGRRHPQLRLSGVEWGPPSVDSPAAGIVVFATVGSGDMWGFAPAWRVGTKLPVVLCDHERSKATGWAPSFDAFVFRAIVDDYLENLFAHRRDPKAPDPGARLVENAQLAGPYLTARQVRGLARVAASPVRFKKAGAIEVPARGGIDAIVRPIIAFPKLGRTLAYTEPPPRAPATRSPEGFPDHGFLLHLGVGCTDETLRATFENLLKALGRGAVPLVWRVSVQDGSRTRRGTIDDLVRTRLATLHLLFGDRELLLCPRQVHATRSIDIYSTAAPERDALTARVHMATMRAAFGAGAAVLGRSKHVL